MLALLLAFQLASLLDFGFSGLVCGRSSCLHLFVRFLLLIGPSLPVSEGSTPICMSELSQLGRGLRELTSSIRELTLVSRELVRLRTSEEVGEKHNSSSASLSDIGSSWELVTDGTSIPGAPADYLLKQVVIQFEDGPPVVPDFCLQLASKNFSSSKASTSDRAREAFRAGWWARAFWSCHTDYQSTYNPGVAAAAHWVLRKGSGFDLIRVQSQADSDRLCRTYSDIQFVEKLPTLTELHIFCAGAFSPVPPLWRWNAKQ